LLGSASIAGIGVRVLRAKLLALTVGPAGIALLAQYGDVRNLLSAVLLAGTGLGIIAVTADAATEGDDDKVASMLQVLYRYLLLPGNILLLAICAATPWWLPDVVGSGDGLAAGAFVIATIAASTVNSVWCGVLQGHKRFDLFAISTGLGPMLGLVALVPLVLIWDWDGALISLGAEAILTALATWWLYRQVRPKSSKSLLSKPEAPPWDTLKVLTSYGGASVAATIVGSGMMVLMRKRAIVHLGADSTGMFQVAYGISQQYVAVVLGALAAYTFPTYRSLVNEPVRLVKEMNDTLRGATLLVVPALIGVMVFRDPLVALLYSSDFGPAGDALRVQLVGDLFKVIGWSIGMFILASGRVVLHVVNEVIYYCVMLGAFELSVHQLGIVAPSFGVTITQVTGTLFVYALARHYIGFRFTGRNVRLCLLSLAAVGIVFFTCTLNIWVSILAGTAVLAVWAVIAIDKAEFRALIGWLRQRRAALWKRLASRRTRR